MIVNACFSEYSWYDWHMKNDTKFPSERRVDSENFCATLAANIDNENLSDVDFREFVRNTLPIVKYPRKEKDGSGS